MSVWAECLGEEERDMDELFPWPQSWARPCLSTWSLCGFRWLCQLLTVPSILRAPSSLRLLPEH